MSSAVLPLMLAEKAISASNQALLASSVQAGFVVGAFVYALTGVSDRFDPRFVFAASALFAAGCNAMLLVVEIGGSAAIMFRFMTGALLAGVYPVGMKLAVAWSLKHRGLLVSLLIGALTVGSAMPHAISMFGASDWRSSVALTSGLAAAGGLLVVMGALGPHNAQTTTFHPRVMMEAWYNRRIRLAFAGYLGHMWELYAMWTWIGAIALASFEQTMAQGAARSFSQMTTIAAISLGAFACVFAGRLADAYGKAHIAMIAMVLSCAAAIATSMSFGAAPWVTAVCIIFWGITIVPDSAQFSALVADAAAPEHVGSLMTFQTATGFALTFVTVQLAPLLAAHVGWHTVILVLAVGPAMGALAMQKLKRLMQRRVQI